MKALMRLLPAAMLLIAELAHADTRGSLDVHGVQRFYLVHLPPHLSSSVPLLLVFHGAGSSAGAMVKVTGLDGLSDAGGFIVVYPAGKNGQWDDERKPYANPADDIGFVSALLAKLPGQYPIDRARIYAAGMSNGAIFVQTLACKAPGSFAAIAAVSGTVAAAVAPSCTHAVSMLEIHGTADPVVSYKGGDVHAGGLPYGAVLSVDATVKLWSGLDGCTGMSLAQALPPLNPNAPTRIAIRHAIGCRPGLDVVAYAVAGGGHHWPGAPNPAASVQLDASQAIVAFFMAHALPH